MPKRPTTLFEAEFNRAMDLRESKPYEALAIFKNLDEKYPNEAVIKGIIASVYFTYLKRFDEALPYARNAVSLSPRSELASLTLFHTLSNLNFEAEALEEARRYVRLKGMTPGYEFLFSELDGNGYFD